MHDLDIGYSVIVSRTRLNALRRLVEKQAYMSHELVKRYSEFADKAAVEQNWSSKRYWDGVVSTMEDTTEMIDEILTRVQALAGGSNEDQEKEGAPKDAPLKNHQPHYTTSAS